MDGTQALVGVETRCLFDCHITVSDMAPGSGSGVEKRGRGWVVGCCCGRS